MKNNSIVFFCNAGIDDGLGHLMRCLSLADAIKDIDKNSIYFFSNDPEGIVIDRVINEGYKFKKITSLLNNEFISSFSNKYAEFIHWIIIDLKKINSYFFNECRKIAKVLHFDDDICRSFNSNIIVNNHIASNKGCYQLGIKSKLLIGPKFNTVNKSFFEVGSDNKNNEHILITLGGEDPEDFTSWFIEGLSDIFAKNRVIVAIGPANPNHENIKKKIAAYAPHIEVIFSPKSLSKYTSNAIIAITAGGVTCYELAAARVPQCMVALENHQKSLINGFISNDAAIALGSYNDICIDNVKKIVRQLLKDKKLASFISKNAFDLIPINGPLNIVEEMHLN
jgi:spore coat polysaccharide biosynthesis predicted glycosyltransferase SpsG